ncbi:MAG TPA: ATP-binding protein [Candidatus Eisenbacteria bacterium]|nr:ATP-binding protein [Candidatus Eisenbacteria bacterium]
MLEDQLASSLKSVRDTARDPSLAKLAAIVEACPEAMIACGSDGRVETWNAGATQVFGLPADRIMGRNVSDLIAEGCREEFARLLHEASVGMARMLFRTLGQHDDGRFIDLSMSLSPLRTPEGTVTGVGVVARDVSALRRAEDEAEIGRQELVEREAALQQALLALRTSHEELKRTQLQLIQAAKLDSVGRLAAGVAHEVKNPLAMILAGTEYLLGMPAGSNAPAAEPVLRDIRAAVDRASAVIKGLLNYASSTELDAKPSDLHAVIDQALGLTQHAMKSGHIHIQKEFASGMPPIPLDVHKIQQVFINLVINAVDAMPAGGTLTIRTQRKQLNAGDQSVGHRRTDPLRVGESVVLVAFEDSGAGITPEHLSHIFDPFFTTKPTGKGTGLGLAVSRTIVALHGGTIWVANRPEGGASFTVVLRSATK